LISKKLQLKAVCDKPGTIQRVSMQCASQIDIDEAYRVGQFALSKAVEGESDKMVILKRKRNAPYYIETDLVELEEVALKTKMVPDRFINSDSNYVTQEFADYAMPLIGEPLPEYARLRKITMDKKLPPYH
jgi:6-phosphofructokinase 1